MTASSSRTSTSGKAPGDWAVVDRDCVIGPGAEVGSPDTDPDDSDAIVLVGRGSRIGRGVTLDGGARMEPGTTA